MSIRDYKITDAQFSEKGVIAAPDTLTGTAAENKGVFDRFAREVFAPQFNAIVEVFAQMEESTDNWSAEEAQRVQQENARQSAEQGRVSAEGQRETNETARLSAEENRISAENDRVTAETARVNAENKRDSAEKSRVSAENARNVWQTYDAAKTYVPGNKVSFGGSSYVCTAETVGHEPTDTAYWLLIAQKGADGAGADDLRQINNALDAVDPTKITAKAEPADGDGVMIADSADGGKAKRLLWSNVKAALGKLFVPLARKVNGKTLSADVTLTAADIKMPNSEEDVGAAMAKRAVWDAVLVSQQSALAWAAAQKEPKQCGFDPHTTDTPYEGYWCAELTLHAPSNQWRVLYVTNVVTLERWFNIYNIDHWIGWRQVSLAVAPEVHNFPLANGFTGDLIYYKTQENICTVSGCIYGTFAKDSYISIGYLPEGFHSAHALELPVTASYGVGVRCSVATDGNVTVIISTSGVAYVYLNISFPCT